MVEYRLRVLEYDDLEAALNRYGRDRWEVVNTWPYNNLNGYYNVLMKRSCT